MHFASAMSHELQTEVAMQDVLAKLAQETSPDPTHLGFVFASPHHLKALPDLLPLLQERLAAPTLIGCTGGGIIGDHREIENRPALALMAASLPGVTITPFHIEPTELEEAWPDTYWQRRLALSVEDEPVFVLLPDPYSLDASGLNTLLDSLNSAFPQRPILGGLASGGQSRGSCALFLNGEVLHGAIGVGLTGNLTVRTVVSQGCKPVGQPQIITRCEGQIIYALGGRPALEVVQEILHTLTPEDQRLARVALLMGRVIDEYKDSFDRGDFLIRTLMGADPQSGAIAVGDTFHVGQTVQLHVRDATTAREDLRALMQSLAPELATQPARGALLFSCNGRGVHLYGEPDYDSRAIAEITGLVPIAGFFCNGEIGPIGNTTFLHGFTASIGIFQAKE